VRVPAVNRLLTFVVVDGHLLRVSIRGEGRPLLLVMGLGGNIEMWDPLERALNGRGIQTIAYDASGSGHSPTRLVPQRMPGLARQAAHLLDALGHPSADVLGVSYGGAVAQELTLGNPHRVRRLVLASTTCGLGGVPGNPLAMSLLATPLRYYSPAFLRLTAGVLYGPTISGKEDLLREQVLARRARPPTLWGYTSQLIAAAGWTSLPWLGRITTPTLVLAGDRDPIAPPRNARLLARRIPNAQLELVHGAGHLLLYDQARHCAAVIADFLHGGSTGGPERRPDEANTLNPGRGRASRTGRQPAAASGRG
jgi:poly(3-hydroxyalkanoate) depolymerase